MRQTGMLVFMLTIFAVLSLVIFGLSADNPRMVDLLAALSGTMAMPLSALVAIFLWQHRLPGVATPDHSTVDRVQPIIIAGNGPSDVRVEVGSAQVIVSVIGSGPMRRDATAGPIARSSLAYEGDLHHH